MRIRGFARIAQTFRHLLGFPFLVGEYWNSALWILAVFCSRYLNTCLDGCSELSSERQAAERMQSRRLPQTKGDSPSTAQGWRGDESTRQVSSFENLAQLLITASIVFCDSQPIADSPVFRR